MKSKDRALVGQQAELYLPPRPPPLSLPGPTPGERDTITEATRRVRGRHRRTQLSSSPTRYDTVQLHSPHSDAAGFAFELRDAFGTTSGAFARAQIDHIRRIVGSDNGKPDMDAVNAVIAIVHGFRPQNEIEAANAVQIGLSHHVSAKLLGLGVNCTQPEHRERYLNLATKVQRTMVAQIDLSVKLRGRPEAAQIGQVTISDGGQAIVGATVNIDARRQENGG